VDWAIECAIDFSVARDEDAPLLERVRVGV